MTRCQTRDRYAVSVTAKWQTPQEHTSRQFTLPLHVRQWLEQNERQWANADTEHARFNGRQEQDARSSASPRPRSERGRAKCTHLIPAEVFRESDAPQENTREFAGKVVHVTVVGGVVWRGRATSPCLYLDGHVCQLACLVGKYHCGKRSPK